MAGCSRTACATRLLPLLLALLLALPAVVQAQFSYETNNGKITITGYTGPGGAVTIPETINGLPVTSIGGYAFYYCTSLTSVTIPNSVTSIGSYAFCDCSSLSSVTIGTNVTRIADRAFNWCTRLTSVVIPNSVTSLGECAFAYCSSLSAITVDTHNTSYSSVAGVLFDKSQTTLIEYPGGRVGIYTIPDSVTSIGDWAFGGCSSLTNVTIPNSVTNIGDHAFESCGNLTSVTIPDSVTCIGDGAFSDCYSLTNVTIGDSVTSIGDDAFYYCTSLTNVTIGNSVTSIGDEAFLGCTSLTAITVDALNFFYSSLDGVFFNKTQTTLIQYPGGKAGNYAIPDSVTNIGNLAFCGCHSLTNVTIPDSVTNIGAAAFSYCYSLTNIYFRGNAPSAGGNCFYDATNATVYYLPGTTGWDTTFGGRPAVLWNPSIQTANASFGVRTNRFGFNVTGTINIPVVVEACTSPASASWTSLQTCTLTNGLIYFSDPQWTNYPARFYRLRSP
jgi:hypothetical protein